MDKQKAIWITGASSGLGKSLSLQFLKNGYTVIGSARREEELKRVTGENTGGGYIPRPLDLRDHSEVEAFVKEISNEYEIECLINNAGITSWNKAEEDDLEYIKQIIETNLLGAIYAIKACLPSMMTNKSGRIINILSVVTQKLFTNSSAYSASKTGLLAYTKVLREETREHNIRITNVMPGAIKTPIWPNKALEKHADRMMNPDEVAKLIYDLYNINTNLVPEELVIRPVKGDL